MEVIYLLVTMVGLLLALPVIGAVLILIVGFINRFRDIPPLSKKRRPLSKAGDSMRINGR